MCTRFTTLRVNATGSSNDVGLEAAGRSNGLVPDGMPKDMTNPVGRWHLADAAVELADAPIGDPADQLGLSVLTLGVEAL